MSLLPVIGFPIEGLSGLTTSAVYARSGAILFARHTGA